LKEFETDGDKAFMIHLRSIEMRPTAKKLAGFPFDLPVVRKFGEIKFRSPVTFLVGENGRGSQR
jgi:predicted ATPase